MPKVKATITIDRARVDEAQRLVGAPSTSATIDLALRALISAERLRRDVAAYSNTEATLEELALARMPINWSDLADDTDWEAVYSGGGSTAREEKGAR